jgi:hypothetical protein
VVANIVPPLLIGLPLVRYRAAADPLLIIAMVLGVEVVWRRLRIRLASGVQAAPVAAEWR